MMTDSLTYLFLQKFEVLSGKVVQSLPDLVFFHFSPTAILTFMTELIWKADWYQSPLVLLELLLFFSHWLPIPV